MKSFFLLTTTFLLAPLAGVLADSGQIFSSGPERVSLIELYTSEGCSSCPPAEAWLSGLRKSDDLWKKFVPIAFHVTYWNYLGWTDVASQEVFNERQRTYAGSWRSGSVYTPCFIKNGEEWHREGGVASDARHAGILTAEKSGANTVKVTFQTLEKGDYVAHLATISSGLETKVKAGENSGRDLRHDFVALSLQKATFLEGDNYSVQFALPDPGKNPPKESGIVAWVTKLNHLNPLQATGGIFDSLKTQKPQF